MELLTFGSVPISWSSWARCWHMKRERGWQGYCPHNGVSLFLKPTKQTLCIKTCSNTIFLFSSNQETRFSAKTDYIFCQFRKYFFTTLLPMQAKVLVLRESSHPWTLSRCNFLLPISRLLHIWGRGLDFVLSLCKAIFSWRNFMLDHCIGAASTI